MGAAPMPVIGVDKSKEDLAAIDMLLLTNTMLFSLLLLLLPSVVVLWETGWVREGLLPKELELLFVPVPFNSGGEFDPLSLPRPTRSLDCIERGLLRTG